MQPASQSVRWIPFLGKRQIRAKIYRFIMYSHRGQLNWLIGQIRRPLRDTRACQELFLALEEAASFAQHNR